MVGSKSELEALQAANEALDRGMSDGFELPVPDAGDSDAALAEINRRLD